MSVKVRSLDKFYKYLENRESGESEGEQAAEAKPVAIKPPPESRTGLRYVIRNGVTVAVPREEAAPPQTGPVPKDASASLVTETSEQIASEAPLIADSTDDDGAVWRGLPENVQRLAQLSADLLPDAVSQTPERRQLIERLLNPLISLEDTARLLGVCTATVRRYANKGALAHQRTIGQQRRFLLSDVLALLESRKAASEETP